MLFFPADVLFFPARVVFFPARVVFFPAYSVFPRLLCLLSPVLLPSPPPPPHPPSQSLVSLLEPISRAKYPDLTEDEERISLPLQVPHVTAA